MYILTKSTVVAAREGLWLRQTDRARLAGRSTLCLIWLRAQSKCFSP